MASIHHVEVRGDDHITLEIPDSSLSPAAHRETAAVKNGRPSKALNWHGNSFHRGWTGVIRKGALLLGLFAVAIPAPNQDPTSDRGWSQSANPAGNEINGYRAIFAVGRVLMEMINWRDAPREPP